MDESMNWYFVYHWNDGVESYPYSHTVGPAATEAEARELLISVLERTRPGPHYTYHIKYGYPLGIQPPARDTAAQ